jgi:hypothetical protein
MKVAPIPHCRGDRHFDELSIPRKIEGPVARGEVQRLGMGRR